MRPKLRHWLSDRCFHFIHRRHLVYNACWEDPALDRVALQLGPRDTVLAITSAGCNVLDYILAGAGRIYAVDVNFRQNALLELKKAAIGALDFADFFQLLGRGKHPRYRQIYHDALRPALPDWARPFWDRQHRLFNGKGWRGSFYFRGAAGTFARLMNTYIDRIAKVRAEIDALLAADSVDEQQDIYQRLHPRFWKRFLKWAIRRDAALSLLGVPRLQRMHLDRYYPGGIARFIEDALEAVFTRLPLKDNYFWRVYLTGEYTPNCCPEYLRRENFHRLKSGLLDRISTHTATVTDFLRARSGEFSTQWGQDVSRFTRFVLLDHMDWLAHPPSPPWKGRDQEGQSGLQAEWQAILDSAAPGARVIYRSGGLKVEYVDPLEVELNGRTRRLGDLLHYHTALARDLHQTDRVHTYGSFSIADIM
jgi:S-adenosylmethionine-diacylglycerol 3-amino-3-carboxypropyl transferase